MSNSYFKFKQFNVNQDRTGMKVCTDSCLFGAWVTDRILATGLTSGDVLDIGTGTGLLSLMIAQKTDTTITAIEIEESAAQQAEENFEASVWSERLQVLTGDVLTSKLPKNYDLIVCNPPFFVNHLKSADDNRNKALHTLPLYFEDLIFFAKSHLNSRGMFTVLLPSSSHIYFKEIAAKAGFFLRQEVAVKQTENHDFFRFMLLFKPEDGPTLKSSITIKAKGAYTAEFIDLLKDYYLYL